MALSGTFEADFSEFYDAVNTATVKLVDFEVGAAKVDKTLNRMAESFSGKKIIAEAALMAKAVEDAGGVAALTEKELARVGRTANEAAEKMKALGLEVPANLQQLADATANAGDKTETLSVSVFDMVKAYVSAEAIIGLVTTAYHALISVISESIAEASEAEQSNRSLLAALEAQGMAMPSVVASYADYNAALQKTSVYSGDAITAAQTLLTQIGGVMPRDMEKATLAAANLAAALGKDLPDAAMMIAKAANGSTEQLDKLGIEMTDSAGNALTFSDALDNVNEKFGGAAAAAADTYAGRLAQLGNAWDDVKESIGRAIVQNETVRTALEGITKLVNDQNSALEDNAAVNRLVSDTVIVFAKGISLAADGLNHFVQKVNEGRFYLDALGVGMSKVIPGFTFFRDDMIQSVTTMAEWSSGTEDFKKRMAALTVELEATRGKTVALTAAQQDDAKAREQATRNLEAQQAAAKKAADEHAAEVKKLNEAIAELDTVGSSWQETLAGMNEETVNGIASYLEAGAAQGTLATAYGVTASQVKAVTIMLKEQADAQDLATKQAQIMNKLQLEYNRTVLEGSKDVLNARLADIQSQADAQIASLKIQQTGTEEMYSAIQAIADQASVNLIQRTLEGDDATRASFEGRAEVARVAYEQALQYSDQYTSEEIARRADALNQAEADAANWTSIVNGNLQTTNQLAGSAAGAIRQVNAEMDQTLSLLEQTSLGSGSIAWDATKGLQQIGGESFINSVAAGQGSAAMGNTWFVSMAQKASQDAWDQTIAKRLQDMRDAGAGIFAPQTQHNSVKVEPGAVQMQFPVMNDPRAMNELARVVGDSIMARLTRSGTL